jgi:hypothetical protein
MPCLPSLKALPIEGDPVWREVRLLAVRGRRYSPALDAFVKVARLRDWSLEVEPQHRAQHYRRPEMAIAATSRGSSNQPGSRSDTGSR